MQPDLLMGRYEDGNLVENLNDTTSLTYEVIKGTPTSRYALFYSSQG